MNHHFDEPHYGRWRPLVWFAAGERIVPVDDLLELIARHRRDAIPNNPRHGGTP